MFFPPFFKYNVVFQDKSEDYTVKDDIVKKSSKITEQ